MGKQLEPGQDFSFDDWLERLGTARLSRIAFNIYIRSQESGHTLDLDQAWLDEYLEFCERKGVNATSTLEDVEG